MVLVICTLLAQCTQTGNIFTFQYGDTDISVTWMRDILAKTFTFQYGDTDIHSTRTSQNFQRYIYIPT